MAEQGEGDDGLAEQTTKTVFSSYVCRSSLPVAARPHPGGENAALIHLLSLCTILELRMRQALVLFIL